MYRLLKEDSKAQTIKENYDKFKYIKNKNICSLKDDSGE